MPMLVVGLVQMLLVASVAWNGGDLTSQPIRVSDYAPHFYMAQHAVEHLRNVHALWGYDPFWMAGYPEGQVTLVDNKLFCALMLLAPRGWEALAFNSGVLLSLVAVPWCLYFAARSSGHSRGESQGSALAAIAATFCVPATVLFWSGGGISFFLASVVAVPLSVRLAAIVGEGSLFSGKGMATALLAVVGAFVHPLIILLLLAGLVPAAVSRSRPLSRRFRDLVVLGGLLSLAIVPILEASVWLRGQLRPIDPAAHGYFLGGLNQLILDWVIFPFDTTTGVFGPGALLPILALAVLGRTHAAGEAARVDAQTRLAERTIASVTIVCALSTYLAPSFIERFALLQPYRFLVPLCFFLCVPAGRGIARILPLVAKRRPLACVLAAVVLVVVLSAGRGLAPWLVLATGYDAAESRVVDFVQRATSEEDRILVESTVTPLPAAALSNRTILIRRFALLPFMVRREFLGYMGNSPFTAHRYASFRDGRLFGRELKTITEPMFREVLRRYAVSWIVACDPAAVARLRLFATIIEPLETLADCQAFRVLAPERSRFHEGEGHVRADLDRIEVDDASGERVVLKYHWVPNLRTSPPLPIEEARQPGAAVGFIAVRPQGVRTFTIQPRGPFEIGAAFAPARGF